MHRVLSKTSPISLTHYSNLKVILEIFKFLSLQIIIHAKEAIQVRRFFLFFLEKKMFNTFNEEGCRRPPLFSIKLGNEVFVKDNEVTTRWNMN